MQSQQHHGLASHSFTGLLAVRLPRPFTAGVQQLTRATWLKASSTSTLCFQPPWSFRVGLKGRVLAENDRLGLFRFLTPQQTGLNGTWVLMIQAGHNVLAFRFDDGSAAQALWQVVLRRALPSQPPAPPPTHISTRLTFQCPRRRCSHSTRARPQ